MRSFGSKSLFVCLVGALALTQLASCRSKPPEPLVQTPRGEPTPPPETPRDLLVGVDLDAVEGMLLELGDAAREKVERDSAKVAAGAALGAEQAKKLLARLPKLIEEAADRKGFAFRERSMPPPRTGTTVATAFPPKVSGPGAHPQATSEPLKVARFQPDGDIQLAPHLSITFSQPMVAVTSHDALSKEQLPVTLTPEPPGKWRWAGTKTLLFEPEGRFPQATRFSAKVAAGTRSALGGELAEELSWSFATPPPKVISYGPRAQSQPLDAVIWLQFDQRVEAEAVLPFVEVRAGNAQKVQVRLLSASEAAEEPRVQHLVGRAPEGSWLALQAVEPLPKATTIYVNVKKGAPSAEGPRPSVSDQGWAFSTYGPLQVRRTHCGWGDCVPGTQFSLTLSNPLDPERWDPKAVTIEPALEGAQVSMGGSWIAVRGATKGRTTYKVTLPASLTDVYGQTLGQPSAHTFEVGSAFPDLHAPYGTMTVLDPSGPASLGVYSVNHKSLRVQVYRVGPEHWADYLKMHHDWNQSSKLRRVPGKRVVRKTIRPKGERDALTETAIPLDAALNDEGLGHAIVIVEPTRQPKDLWRRQYVVTWVQRTKLGLTAAVDHGELQGWATSLADGAPVSGATLTMWPQKLNATTNAGGLGVIALPDEGADRTNMLVATKGGDVAILPENLSAWSWDDDRWVARRQSDSLRFFVFDDRQMYKPKEKVRVKGWARRIVGGESGGVEGVSGGEVTWTAYDARSNEIAKGRAALTALGGFDFEFDIPDTANLGRSRVKIWASPKGGPSGYTNHYYQIEEFRRPEFEVKVAVDEGPHFVGRTATATVSASYYAGGGLPQAETRWRVGSQQASYRPPNHEGWIFGEWQPWWVRRSSSAGGWKTWEAETGATGEHRLKIALKASNPPTPRSVKVEARVTDVNRQAWAASSTFLVHPADRYVGLKTPRTFVERGQPIDAEIVVTDLEGARQPGMPVEVVAARLEWRYEKGRWTEHEVEPQTCQVESAEAPAKCEFQTPKGGRHRVQAKIVDAWGRPNRSSFIVWVSGGQQPASRKVEREQVTLVPAKETWRPGERAEVLVQAPWPNAEGLWSVRREGVVVSERFTMDGTTHTLEVPVQEAWMPGAHLHVELVGEAARTDERGRKVEGAPARPAYAGGTLQLKIPPVARVLSVKATPKEDVLEPGGETTVTVEVVGADGEPVSGAEVAVVVVDEAVLALSGYQLGDPMSAFYFERGDGVRDYHSRQLVALKDPAALLKAMEEAQAKNADKTARMSFNGGGGKKRPKKRSKMGKADAKPMAEMAVAAPEEAEPEPDGAEEGIALRSDFDALATFVPAVPTGADGRASVEVKLKDSLTRYRVMAVAVEGGRRFGKGESQITARLPLMVRPSAPRFLNFGDVFELPVVLQNQTDQPMKVDVAVRGTNLTLTEGVGRRVTVPANDRVEVRFPAAAGQPGTARIQLAAAAGKATDAAQVSLPVWTPATSEAFATYGEIDGDGQAAIQPVAMPGDALKAFGELSVTTSSTQLSALTDAVVYLVDYPFACSEQLSSRILALAALRDVLDAFDAPGLPDKEALERQVAKDLELLQMRQDYRGGVGFWKRGRSIYPYVSVHVAHALVRATQKGYAVPKQMLTRSKRYLQDIKRHIHHWYSEESKRSLEAYALYVRHLMEDSDPKAARKLVVEAGGPKKMPLEGLGWLLPTLAADGDVSPILQHLNNRVTEEAGTAHFAVSYSDGAQVLLHSDRRADGVLLEALIEVTPKSDLLPKIVRGLLAHKKRGRWSSTQENAFVLLGLDRYFRAFEGVTPDFVARVWLGEGYAGEHTYKGRTTDRNRIGIPMPAAADILASGPKPLAIQKDGAGRLYYRIGMTYAPKSLSLEPSSHGFAVTREYEGIEDPSDVSRREDGTWVIKAGAEVRVRVTMVVPTRRYHVALVDPLPAGLEPLNPALAVTGEVPADPKSSKGNWWWSRPWYEHQNVRDERVEAFASIVWAGVHTYSYVARATTPGEFVVPPPKAEEMYQPETFGRGATAKVVVQ